MTSAMVVSFTIVNQAGLNFQRASSTISQSDLEDRLLDSRPFEAFKNEKISLDFGPWIRQMRGGEGLQVRIRAGKGRRPTRTLRQVVIAIIRLIVKILKRTRGNDFPDLSLWYFTSLHQKEDRVASFNCFFTVQGRTRPLLSHELDIASALSELSQHPLIIPARQHGESTEDDAQGETSTASLEEPLTHGLSQQRTVPFTSTHTRTVLSHDTNVSSVLDELRGHYMPIQGLYPMPTPDDAAAWVQGNNTHTDDAMMGKVQFTYGVLYGTPPTENMYTT